jgi:hypothetical protein
MSVINIVSTEHSIERVTCYSNCAEIKRSYDVQVEASASVTVKITNLPDDLIDNSLRYRPTLFGENR